MMVLKLEQERVHTLLRDTITLLCRNGLSFKTEFSIEALIGITLDKEDVFLVNINEIIRNESAAKVSVSTGSRQLNSEGEDSNSDSGSNSSRSKRQKRKHKIKIKQERNSFIESDNNDTTDKHEDDGSLGQTDSSPQQNTNNGKLTMKQDCDESNDIVIIKEEDEEEVWNDFTDSSNFPSSSVGFNASFSAHQSFQSPNMSAVGGYNWSQSSSPSQLQMVQPAEGTSHTGNLSQMHQDIYPCGKCGKILKTRSSLSVHLKLHDGKYNYRCQICDKGFSSTSMLQGHMSWHTGIKEFKCTLCQKEYRYSHELKQHVMKMHVVGEKARQTNNVT